MALLERNKKPISIDGDFGENTEYASDSISEKAESVKLMDWSVTTH